MYQCFETAHYYDKTTGLRIPDYEAWMHIKTSSINFSEWPQTSYVFDEDKVEVKPRHFENVKVLWRPRQQTYKPEGIEDIMSEEEIEH